MNLFRNHFKDSGVTTSRIEKTQVKKLDKEGRRHVLMHTNVFSQVGDNLLTSNSMFASLLSDILPCLEPFSLKDRVTVDAYESKKIDDAAEQVVVSGFRRYVGGCLMALQKKLLSRIITFSAFFILGVVLEFILYGVLNGQMEQMWLFKTIEVLATLFIWQFGGYIAFEFFGARKRIIRYKQVLDIKFNVKHWE